ncbi:MAG: TAXI family TRAP transporter solute-binding subunit [Desulfosarcina sp.]|jgi:TRAP transporter TAXI family solute receptor
MIRLPTLKANDGGEKLKIFGPAIVLTIIGFVVAYQFVSPAPPRALTMATGSPAGAYFAAGQTYREMMAQDGVSLELKNTSGSVENLRLLQSPSAEVDIAFVQGGLSQLAETDNLVALGSLFFEPMWVFQRAEALIQKMSDLQQLHIAVGPEGSGSRALTLQMLALNGINEANSQIVSYDNQMAADMLLKGQVDVAFFVSNYRSAYIQQLSRSKSVRLLGIDRAEAYAIRFPFLHVLKLPQGVLDLQANIPSRDLMLVAPTAQLVARADLHPALIQLLLQAAEKIHFKGGGFEKIGQFPTPQHIDFRLSEEAAHFYKSGPTFLQRYLPFWVANFISRTIVMLLPLVALLLPLFKLMPPLYRWRMRSKIYRWYKTLETIDAEINSGEMSQSLQKTVARLDDLEKTVAQISVPLAFREELYDLRLHIDLLRKKLGRGKIGRPADVSGEGVQID